MGFLFAFLCASFYSISNILMKKGMRLSDKDNGVFMTLFMNVAIMGLASVIYRFAAKNPSPPTGWGIVTFVAAGLLTLLFARSMLFAGIRRIGPSRSIAMKNSAPLFTLIFAVFVLDEAIGTGPWTGIGLLFFGLFLQGFQLFREGKNGGNVTGYVFAMCAAVGFGLGQGVRKQALAGFDDPFAGAVIGALAAFIGFLLIEAWKGNLVELVKSNLQFANKFYFMAGIFTSFAILSFFTAIWYIQVAYVGAIAAVEPVLTVMLSRFFLRSEEKLSPLVAVSAIVVFAGAGVIAFTA